jgi:hypothetical protein
MTLIADGAAVINDRLLGRAKPELIAIVPVTRCRMPRWRGVVSDGEARGVDRRGGRRNCAGVASKRA